MAIPIIKDWEKYFREPHEGLGSSYERIILNELLYEVSDKYNLQTAIEAPSFGFTGLSGINLMGLALKGVRVSLEDHEPARIELIKALWESVNLPLSISLNDTYQHLNYPDNSFDLGYNFSALWFTAHLGSFLAELCRVCSKAILLCVPNRQGIGYKMQIKDYSPERYPMLKPAHIDPLSIRHLMQKNNWSLVQQGYIDCPPWPDIGMNKELFLNKLLGKEVVKPQQETTTPVSIMPFYKGEDAGFRDRMLKFSFVEKAAPNCFKRYWAHHYYMLFVPAGDSVC